MHSSLPIKIEISANAQELGQKAGKIASEKIKAAIRLRGVANIILATGTSQFETLNQLISDKEIEWDKVNMFHLDEYIGLKDSHKASFRKYLRERVISKLPSFKSMHLIQGDGNVTHEIDALNYQITQHPIDVALIGIGENGHLAFNDPPADFETETPYIIVHLDQACRQQQVNERWFESLDEVPSLAISMSIHHILKSKSIICSVPDERKAIAVGNTIYKDIDPLFPSTALRNHTDCVLYLDPGSASMLKI